TSYLESKASIEEKQQEIQLEDVKQKAEIERMTLLKDGMLSAIKEHAGVDTIERAEGIQEHTAKAFTGVLKGASDATHITITGVDKV
ncbi:hypothetical protein LAM19_23505, partial [Mycobacterium tuberculosis]|nr:hypothetical protein [Mycobacterium tuberculosis]